MVYGKVFVADFYKTCSRSSLLFFFAAFLCMYGGIKDKFNLFEKADSGTDYRSRIDWNRSYVHAMQDDLAN